MLIYQRVIPLNMVHQFHQQNGFYEAVGAVEAVPFENLQGFRG